METITPVATWRSPAGKARRLRSTLTLVQVDEFAADDHD